jgi:hypothetical protein
MRLERVLVSPKRDLVPKCLIHTRLQSSLQATTTLSSGASTVEAGFPRESGVLRTDTVIDRDL